MAEFNSEMYLQQRTPDILGGIQSGMKIGEMKRQRKAADTAEMFKKGLREAATTDANGNVTYDQKRMSALGGMFPQEVSEIQKQSKEAAFEQKKREQEIVMKHQEYAAPIVLSMTEPQSYQLGLQKLKAAGNPMAQELPPEFDPKLMSAYHRQVTPVAQYFAMKKEQADNEIRREDMGLKRQELAANRSAKNVEVTSGLRKERSGLPTTAATQKVSAAYNKIQNAAQNSSAAGDLSLIFGFMTMQDPQSSVKEGEFATAQNTAGVSDQIRNAYNKALAGTRLTPEQRADFLKQAGGLYNSQLDQQKKVDATYGELAKRSGADPRDVLLDFEANKVARPAGYVDPDKLSAMAAQSGISEAEAAALVKLRQGQGGAAVGKR